MQNEPNFKNDQMLVTAYYRSIYGNFRTFYRPKNEPKRTQFEPKTNPIYRTPKMNVSDYITKEYEIFWPPTRRENKANQSQFKANSNPKRTQFTERQK